MKDMEILLSIILNQLQYISLIWSAPPPGFESEITEQLLRTVSNFLKATAKK